MLNFLKKNKGIFMCLIDALLFVIAYCLAFIIRFEFSITAIAQDIFHLIALINNMPWILLVLIIFYFIFQIHKSLWEYTSLKEIIGICFFSVVSNFVIFCIVLLVPVTGYVRSLPVIASMIIILEMLAVRVVYRAFRRSLKSSDRNINALIIGAGDAGLIMLRDLTLTDRYHSKVIGFVDDNPNKVGKNVAGYKVLGTTDDLAKLKEKIEIDVVYIAIQNITKDRLSELIRLCQENNLAVKIMNFQYSDSLEETHVIRDVSIDDLLGRGEIHLETAEIAGYLEGKTIMITGGGGSIGSELCRQILHYKPSKIICFDIYENNMYALQQEIAIKQRHNEIDSNIEILCLIGSVRDYDRLEHVIKKYQPDVLYHAAAHKHVPLVEDSPKEAVKNNVFGTYNTLKCCIANKVDRFILISTDKAVNPTNVMGATKRMCEMIVQGHRNNGITKVAAVRFGNVLGSNGSVIPLFKEQIQAGGPVTVTHKDIERFFMTIPEAAQLVLQAGAYAKQGDIFVLDMGRPVKILKLAEDLIRLSGLKPYEDIKIEFTGLRPGEKMYEEISLGYEKRHKTANNLIYVNEPMDITYEEIIDKLNQLKNAIEHEQNKDVRKLIISIIANNG